jgi:hypothetical protein
LTGSRTTRSPATARAAPESYEALRQLVLLGGYWNLPAHVRELADKNYVLLKDNPQHPSLHFKKIGRFWSVRVGLPHRALAVEVEDGLVWF